jgi:pilus retraction protein PilT
MESLLKEICPEKRWKEFLEKKDLDLAHEVPGLARFRANYLYNHWGQAAVLRQIPAKILSFSQLNLPEALKKLCHLDQGLVVVTGPTGSGKSTTLAAMIDYINDNLARHIITIEDPIEFVHPCKKSTIVHREVGEHTETFGAALKGAMRHDPDILLLGEMREMETIKLALSCASMGMLVFGTLHTNNAPKTVDRIINTFPAEEQNQVRVMLAGCFAGVVAQLLCKKVPKGRVAVHEIIAPARGPAQHHPHGPDLQHPRHHRERQGGGHDHDGQQPHGPREGRHRRAQGSLHEGQQQGPLRPAPQARRPRRRALSRRAPASQISHLRLWINLSARSGGAARTRPDPGR